jgi:hypothetical protein
VQHPSTTGSYIARFISIIFHPVFVPALVYACILYVSPDILIGVAEKSRNWWLVIIAYITITFPLLVVFLLWRLKFIQSMHMHETRERYGPLIASMLFYFWTFWLFHKQFQAPLLIQSFLLGVFLTTVMLFMATIFFKISLHAGAWGTVFMFSILCAIHQASYAVFTIIVVVLISGMVGTARLYLKEHTPGQLYSAYILGMVMQAIAYFICNRFLN